MKEFEQPAVDDLDDLVAGARGRFDNDRQEEPEDAAPEPEPELPGKRAGASGRDDGRTAERHDGATAKQSSKFTVLLDPKDATLFDELALVLRRRMGGQRVGKGDIVRALLQSTMYAGRPDRIDDLADWLSRPLR